MWRSVCQLAQGTPAAAAAGFKMTGRLARGRAGFARIDCPVSRIERAMPVPTTAELTALVAFPSDSRVPLWQERRTVPLAAFYGVPIVFLLVGAITVQVVALRIGLVVVASGVAWMLVRARQTCLIETLTLSAHFVTVEQPGGGRVALPTEALTAVVVKGDKIRLESTLGVVTLGFVRRQKAFVRALQEVAPTIRVGRDMEAFCST